MKSDKDSLDEIKRQLTNRIEELSEDLLGPPTKDSRRRPQWAWNSTGGLFVVVRGAKRGAFYQHAGGKGGGPLDLIMFTRGGDFANAVTWAKSWLGMSHGGGPPPIDTTALLERQRKRKTEEARAVAAERQRVGRAQSYLKHSVPINGTVAETYLTQTRGIPVPQRGWPHEVVRFHPPSRALVVAMTADTGEVRAIQRIYLTPEGTKISKEEARQRRLPGAKQTGGVMAGAMVHLPGAENGPLLIAEGPETALSVWSATGYETWAALGGVAKITPPSGRHVVICADDDAPNSPAAKKLKEALESWAEEGRDVAVALPWAKPRGDKSDFNDVIQESAAEAVRQRIAAAQLVSRDLALPHYPRPRLSGEHAGRRLRRLVRGFFDRVERQLEARDWIRDEAERLRPAAEEAMVERIKAKLPRVGISFEEIEEIAATRARKIAPRMAKRQAKQAAQARFGRHAVSPAPRLQIAAAAGLGKTTAIIDEILNRPALWTRNIYVYARDLALCDDFASRFTAAAQKIVPDGATIQPQVKVIRGREKETCRRLKMVEAAGNAGCSSIHGTVCHTRAAGKRPESFCPAWEWCQKEGYVSQFLDRRPAIRVMAHQRLGLHQPSDLVLPEPDCVIVDERAVDALTASDVIEPSDLVQPSTYDAEIGEEQRIQEAIDTATAVLAGLQGEKGVIAAIQAAGIISSATLREAGRAAALSATKAQPAVHAGLDQESAVRVLNNHRPHPGLIIKEMFFALARAWEAGRQGSAAVKWDAEHTVRLEDGSTALHPIIRLHHRKPALGAPPGTPLVLIDADADLGINRRLFGSDLRGFSIAAVRHAFVVQIGNHALSKSSLAPGRGLPNNSDKAERLLERIAKLVRREAQGGKKVLVVAAKKVRLALTDEENSWDLPISTRWCGAELTHFGRHLGNDQWRDHDTVIVIGREQLPPIEAERLARCIWGDDMEMPPLELPGAFITEKRRHDLRHGQAPAVEVQVHPCPQVQAILELMRECAIGQAIDRLRLIHRPPDRPARVIVLTNLPVPGLTVDELLPLDEVLEGGTTVELALQRMPGGVLPLAPAWLAEHMRPLFSSERTARREVERALDKWPLGNKKIYCRVATYTCHGKRRPSRALVRMDVLDPSAELARLMGKEITKFCLLPGEAPDTAVNPSFLEIGALGNDLAKPIGCANAPGAASASRLLDEITLEAEHLPVPAAEMPARLEPIVPLVSRSLRAA